MECLPLRQEEGRAPSRGHDPEQVFLDQDFRLENNAVDDFVWQILDAYVRLALRFLELGRCWNSSEGESMGRGEIAEHV